MFATLFSLFLAVVTCDAFCLPSDDCWPSSQEWEGLDSALSGDLVALSVDGTDDTYQVCYDQEDAYELEVSCLYLISCTSLPGYCMRKNFLLKAFQFEF